VPSSLDLASSRCPLGRPLVHNGLQASEGSSAARPPAGAASAPTDPPPSGISVLCKPDLLLSKEPTNLQAQSLNQLIDDGLRKGMLPTRLVAEPCDLPVGLAGSGRLMLRSPSGTRLLRIEAYQGMAIAGGAVAVVGVLVGGLLQLSRRKR
jgi:hypothetical protein